MFHASIAGDLVLGEPLKQQREANVESLQQQYTAKVIINGTLTINNLVRDLADETQIIIAGKPVNKPELLENYLLKNMEQEFTQPVIFENAKVTAPRLQTRYLNDHAVAEHLLNRKHQTIKQPLYIVFMNASIAGDLICKDYRTKLHMLSKNVVRHGEVANITGTKVFDALLTIDNALTLALNGVPVKDFVLRSEFSSGVQFDGTKAFKAIEVGESLTVTSDLHANLLNNLPLAELLSNDYHLERLVLPNKVYALNVVFHKINGISFDAVWVKFNVKDDQLVLHKDLIIEGNVQFNENLNLQQINGINWAEYEASLVRVQENANIAGEKTFLAGLTITNQLQTQLINERDLSSVLRQLLTKSTPQVISGKYSFEHLQLTNLDVGVINDMPTSAFIDTRDAEIVIDSALIVDQLHVAGDMEGQFNEDLSLQNIEQKLSQLTQKRWRNIVVHGNASWERHNIDTNVQHELLQYLYKNAVRRDGDQVISGNVRVQRPVIAQMATSMKFPKNIDIDFIARDCLLKNTTMEQHIVAPKWFVKPLHAANVLASPALYAKLINNIDILQLNASLYHLTSKTPIRGPLRFSTTPMIKDLLVNGTVNGVNTAQLYSSSNVMPPVQINDIVIDDDLFVGDVNDMSLDYLLENRITKNASALEVFGHLKFENLILNKLVRFQAINDIPIDDLVFKRSKHLQAIESSKYVMGNLILAGPAHVLHLNGNDLVALNQKSIFIDRAQTLHSLVVEQATFKDGMRLEENASRESPRIRTKLNALDNDLQYIEQAIDNQPHKRYYDLRYLDYDMNKTFSWEGPNDIITDIYTYAIDRTQPCAMQLLIIEKSLKADKYFLRKRTTNLLTVQAHNLNVKVENFCKLQFHKVKSKITIAADEITQVIGMKKSIVDIDVLQLNATTDFVLLNALGSHTKQHEIRILKIDKQAKTIKDWQSIGERVGKVMKLCKLNGSTLLMIQGAIQNHSAVHIYKFDEAALRFALLQSIAGEYNNVELLPLNTGSYQLVLSCLSCQRIVVYAYNGYAPVLFSHYQTLQSPVLVEQMHAFQLANDKWYLMTSHRGLSGVLHLTIYEWNATDHWHETINGDFHHVQLAVPLSNIDSMPLADNALLLVCSQSECGLVKAVVA